MGQTLTTATLAGGCFWCLEAVYQRVTGIERVVSGYMGGHVANPTYVAICSGETGHAEVVQVQFDASQLTFRELLEIFFTIHDPTTLNRQGHDIGTQYRSAIFVHDEEQEATAHAVIAELTAARKFAQPIVTEVTAASTFYPAEAYHQNYYVQNESKSYCRFIIAPKLQKFEKRFKSRLKA